MLIDMNQAQEKVTYFVVFTRQQGEHKPAYSFMDKAGLDQAILHNIIDKAFIVPTKQLYGPEDVDKYLNQYLNEQAQSAQT